MAKSCSPGYIKRKGYSYRSPSGKTVRVSPACIKRRGSPKPRQRSKPRSPSPQLRCAKGEIARAGYTAARKGKRYRVSPVCIRDIGKPGRGKRVIQKKYKLRQGALTRFGYHIDKSKEERRAALKKALASGMPIDSLILKLNAQAVYRKNAKQGSKRATAGKRFAADRNWVSSLK